MRRILEWIPMLAVVFVAIVLGEMLTPLKRLDEEMGRHREVLIGATAGATALGFVFFMGGCLYRLMMSDGTEFHDGVPRVVVYSLWEGAKSGHRAEARWFKEKSAAVVAGKGLA